MYTKTLIAGWADMDFNAHMRNTAYLDKSADVRMMYFADNGFPMSEFVRLKLGPVVMKDEIEYFRECRLLDEIKVTLSLAGLSEDASKIVLRNDFFREDVLCAQVTSTVEWFDLANQKFIVPPEGLAGPLRALVRTADFKEVAGSVR